MSTPAYMASVVLNPALKWKYVEKKWITEEQWLWIEPSKRAMKGYYETYYNASSERLTPPRAIPTRGNQLDAFENWMTPEDYYEQPATIDQLGAYNEAEPTAVANIINWWREHEATYPNLVKMAFDLHSVPSISAEIERIFSIAKGSVDAKRNRTHPDVLEAIQCLKNWWSQVSFCFVF
jgi:hypothetical protein